MSAASTAAGHRLFRPEALEAQRQALLGRILINTQLAYWWMTYVDLRCCRSDGDASSSPSAGVRFVHVAHPCARRAGRIDTFGWGLRSKLGCLKPDFLISGFRGQLQPSCRSTSSS